MYFEEYSTTPNLTGKLFSCNDMIISMDCKTISGCWIKNKNSMEKIFTNLT
ncbi:hypothetical protein MtrunA17_Chr2g0277811 [Medicago truncatula]|uniref:Uncharacterized protein n=1 Tax=Medicago truncatula TaxID=3880 RepID=A0A396J0H9_MEDTR|nr:hypothetical protein MtrunA17_Chr2g0277811 [Medicago truncatula]